MDQQVWMFLAGQAVTAAVTAAGVYAAIRADLREALVRVAATERRLDRLEDVK